MSSANAAPKLATIMIREKPRRGFHAFASRVTGMAHFSGHRPLMNHHIFRTAAIGVAWKGPAPSRIKKLACFASTLPPLVDFQRLAR
jgi:hypothetical protein